MSWRAPDCSSFLVENSTSPAWYSNSSTAYFPNSASGLTTLTSSTRGGNLQTSSSLVPSNTTTLALSSTTTILSISSATSILTPVSTTAQNVSVSTTSSTNSSTAILLTTSTFSLSASSTATTVAQNISTSGIISATSNSTSSISSSSTASQNISSSSTLLSSLSSTAANFTSQLASPSSSGSLQSLSTVGTTASTTALNASTSASSTIMVTGSTSSSSASSLSANSTLLSTTTLASSSSSDTLLSGAISTSFTSSSFLSSGTSLFSITSAPSSSGSSGTTALPIITSYSPDASSYSTIEGVTTNTHITTSDSSHGSGVFPFLWKCSFCGGGGLLLWGMNVPGIYPPPTPPPVAGWPTITIGPDSNPTPSSEATQTQTQTQTTLSTSIISSTTASSSGSSASSSSSSTTTNSDSCEATGAAKRTIGKREEITAEYDDPLGRALSWLGVDGLQSATGIITNKMNPDKSQANTKVFGLQGSYTLPKPVTVEGVKLSGTVPWKVRWDWDPDTDKKVHVNGEWGKKAARVKVAYKFPASNGLEADQTVMGADVTTLTKNCKVAQKKYRSDVENARGDLVFRDGATLEDAIQAIISQWTDKASTPRPC
ncbi:MAG: hypothetical protein M1834_007448 [Cirrosporium novae-zelandiae]|nr:MAG: hypothetical protein M1834_007448 [Cirrosporium novae-zelandiae]